MSVSAATHHPWIELTPQVQVARQAQLRQTIDIAVLAKSRDIGEQQGAALLQMLQSAAAALDGLGTQLDVRA